MMKFLLISALVLLAGCDVDEKKIKKLEAENALLQDEIFKLKTELSKQQNEDYRNHVKNQAMIESLQNEAAIYQACNYLIPVCPQSMTEKGKEAIKYGYSGGVETFWYLLILKFAAFGALFGVVIISLNYGFLKLIKPSEEKIAQAKELIDTAQNQVESLRNEEENIKEAISNLEYSQEVAQQNLDETFEAIDYQEKELRKLENKINQKKEQLKTLESAKSAFDGIG